MISNRIIRWAGFTLLMIFLMSCAELGYYHQAAMGQWELLSLRRPLEAVRDDPATPAALREHLQLAGEMREFAVSELGLPDNGSYRSYADLQRSFVVRNVFAALPLSLELQQWCFPVAGCVGYRGYFDTAAAGQFAAQLRAQELDVFIGDVPAFSTLGWFDDPLLNTFIDWHPGRLAELLFHELAHQRLYVPGDTTFNESFATFVGQLGARRFLQQHADASVLRRYERLLNLREDFFALILPTREALEVLYNADLADADKHREKIRLLDDLVARYETLKAGEWQSFSGFDRWFYEDLNNAKLATQRAYTRWVPAFQVLYREAGEQLPAFYQQVDELGKLSVAARETWLLALMESAEGV